MQFFNQLLIFDGFLKLLNKIIVRVDLYIFFVVFNGIEWLRDVKKGGGSYSECYVIFRGVVANMLQSVTRGWVGPKKGPKMRYVFYGRPLRSDRIQHSNTH